MNLQELLSHILETEKYLTLATSDKNGANWAAPLCFSASKDAKKIFFISLRESRHAKNLHENPQVGFAIFDSTQPLGTAFWVQWDGHAKIISAEKIPDAIRSELLSRVSIVILNRDYDFYEISVNSLFLPHSERWKDGKPLRKEIS